MPSSLDSKDPIPTQTPKHVELLEALEHLKRTREAAHSLLIRMLEGEGTQENEVAKDVNYTDSLSSVMNQAPQEIHNSCKEIEQTLREIEKLFY